MNNSDSRQVLSRLPDIEFFDRAAELARLYSLARPASAPFASGGYETEMLTEQPRPRHASNLLVLGGPRVGKSELLRKVYDRLFGEGAQTLPFYYGFRASCLDPERFARDYLSQFLAQFIAFRQNDARLIATADDTLASIARAAAPEDYLWIRAMIDSFGLALDSRDLSSLVRRALSAPVVAASRTGLAPFVIIDNFHLLADAGSIKRGGEELEPVRHPGAPRRPERAGAFAASSIDLRSEFLRALATHESFGRGGITRSPGGPVYALCGLRRLMVELIPPDEELFNNLELIRVEPMPEEPLEKMIRAKASSLAIRMSDSTTELMIQQLNRDLFYIQALMDAAAARGSGLKTFMEFERVYTEEVLSGRICHYLSALLRDVAPQSRARRAVLEALGLVVEANDAVPIEAVIERMGGYASDAERLLMRLHVRELVDISYGFVRASSDPVLADYVRAKYRSEIAGARKPLAGEELLREKLKHSYRLMMSRYNRAVESQLVELLSRFDFQSVPATLFDTSAFGGRYRGMSRVQVRRSIDEEQERVRLPQIVFVNDLGSSDQAGISWRLFEASGFEGGVYSEANEVLWLIALVNSKEPLDLDALTRIDQRLESAARGIRDKSGQTPRAIRWYVSKEGFSPVAHERLASVRAFNSTYVQLDLLYDAVIKLAMVETERRPASEFELVIPIEDDAELIAARTVEQIARAADFDLEAINQIKTALIEACINAAEHSDSPDRKIYQRFTIDDDRLTVTVSNKGKTFDWSGEKAGTEAAAPVASLKGSRGRGLQIIRALMDEVRFERTDDGATLVMTKFLKRAEKE
ncbi:MAG TPA: ATP-binding protein [Blastocatellia bacterium]|nr:ATP-binding protein [Blastocatellia bacterium]